MSRTRQFICYSCCLCVATWAQAEPPKTLPDTAPLTMTGAIDRQLVAGVSRYLDARLRESPAMRDRASEFGGDDAVERWPLHRNQLQTELQFLLGMRDPRPTTPQLEYVLDTPKLEPIARGDNFDVIPVRWRAFGMVDGEGLLLRPHGDVMAQVVAVPDADQTPEQLIGLQPGVPAGSRYPIELASRGCRVLIPTIVSRQRNQFSWHGRRVDVTNREFLYRSAFVLGRHLIGYEVQKILAAVDWLAAQDSDVPIGVTGWGEGGGLAFYAGALDDRIHATCVSGYFEPRESLWQQPIDRNVFGRLRKWGDAELAVMTASRGLIIEASAGPQLTLQGGPGAPSQLVTPNVDAVRQEFERAVRLAKKLELPTEKWAMIVSAPEGTGPAFCAATCQCLLQQLGIAASDGSPERTPTVTLHDSRKDFSAASRLHRQMQQLDEHNQAVLRDCSRVRQTFMKDLDSQPLDKYVSAQTHYRDYFAKQIVGQWDTPRLPANPRSRLAHDEANWVGYEVVLDVFPDVIAYGLLLLPKNLAPDEKRPVVVCQHGLEGRPQDVIGEDSFHYYKSFAAKLAERGFITFAPQNLYRFQDDFRVLQRKSNLLGKTLFSIITPQHQQILDWLKTHPNVDAERIGFYGLSYGGKTAMRVPALLPDYCLSICSADFNEWVDKNASTHNPRSYIWTGEYEIFEWDLGNTFNYAEMAALIAPRPFMVERGHDDGVADDETVAFEFAKVRRRYVKLGIADRCEIEWFDGPHTIHGEGTFDFLHRHLRWPVPQNALP